MAAYPPSDTIVDSGQPGEAWVVPQPVSGDSLPFQEPRNIFLDNVEAELSALVGNAAEQEGRVYQETAKQPAAYHELTRVLSCQNCWFTNFLSRFVSC